MNGITPGEISVRLRESSYRKLQLTRVTCMMHFHLRDQRPYWFAKTKVAFLLTNPFSDLVNPDCFNLCVSWNENLKIDRARATRHM